jgi:beta-xylosidase
MSGVVDASPVSSEATPWRDKRLSPLERADALIPLMSLEEKLAQLVGVWVGADATGGGVAPHQADMTHRDSDVLPWSAFIKHGLGQITRPFGTAPVDPVLGARSLAASQAEIVAASRFGIPAQVHEECLTGFAAWRATAFPTPLSWGAAFDPELVERMASRIGHSMRSVGVHQGLAPVLDVTRDYRWGRTEETIGEDPYLVGTVGAAYVRGLESAGVVATLKHFAGYSASRGGRNLAPVHIGRRELADVILPPFEMALRLGGARSVMNSYTEVDSVPVAADPSLLTRLLRDEWGFGGTVVSDYYAVRFLETLHRVAAGAESAAGLALRAGIDVELPTVDTFGTPLLEAVRAGTVPEALVDRALRRVLTQKAELGLLDDDWKALPEDVDAVAFDDDEGREIALRLARQSIVLLRNRHQLPLKPGQRIALIGPVADDPLAMLGCYSFPVHVGVRHPEVEMGVEIASLREVCVLAVGDRAGLFGRGTSGEGCDAGDLRLPGRQSELVQAVLSTGTPTVLVMLAGRPYALGDEFDDAASIIEAFFPGQLGGQALAEVLTGAVNPSGRLPVSVPRDSGGLPATYLSPPLGQRSEVSSVDTTPAFPFGHGLSYTTFEWTNAYADGTEWAVDGEATVRITVRNRGSRAGTDVVQLYLHDPVAQATRPVMRLVGYVRVELEPDEEADVTFVVPADATSFIGVDGRRVIEPGDVELRFGRSSGEVTAVLPLLVTGDEREVGHDRRLEVPARVDRRSRIHGGVR